MSSSTSDHDGGVNDEHDAALEIEMQQHIEAAETPKPPKRELHHDHAISPGEHEEDEEHKEYKLSPPTIRTNSNAAGDAADPSLAHRTHSTAALQTISLSPNNTNTDINDPLSSVSHIPCLQLAGVRSFLYAFFISLSSANLVLGFSSLGDNCITLSVYCICIGFICMAMIVMTHILGGQSAESSMLRRILRAILSLIGVLLVLVSMGAIEWIAEGACPTQRGIRQLTMANIMIILASGLSVFCYYFLRYHFPELRFTSFNKQAGKSLIIFVCLIAIVSSIINLVSHGPNGLETYHYGFTKRPNGNCPTNAGCPDPPPLSLNWDFADNRRKITCFDSHGIQQLRSNGEPDTTMCDALIPDQKPSDYHIALKECPQCVETNIGPNYPAGGPSPKDNAGNHVHYSYVYPDSLYRESFTGGFSDDEPVNDYCRGHYSWNPRYEINWGCFDRSGNSASGCSPRFKPSEYQDLPPRPCPQGCMRLFVSAIVYASILGIVVLGLTISMLCGGKKQARTVQEQLHLQRQEQVEERHGILDPATTAVVASDAVTLEEATVADVPVHPPPQLPPTNEMTIQSLCLVLAFHCRRLGVLCYHLSRALMILTIDGTRTLRPFWRHILVLFGCFLLLGLCILSFLNMLWLADANCRDFSISAIVNTIVSFILAIVWGNLILANKQRIIKKETNPFEVMGLMRQDTDDEHEEHHDETQILA